MRVREQLPIIVNPVAGRKRGVRGAALLGRLLQRDQRAYRIHYSQFPGHARELALSLAREGSEELIVVGGDGTISEVIHGVYGTETVVGVVSVGTGNDLARSVGLPVNNVEKSYEILNTGAVGAIDVGREADGGLFVSSLALGWPAEVVSSVDSLTMVRGAPAFLLGALLALRKLHRISVSLNNDDREVELDCIAILVQNTPFTGGGLKVAPLARVDDGLLDVVVVGPVGALELARNLPAVYRGTHTGHPRFSTFQTRSVRIASMDHLAKVRDGDLAGELPIDVQVCRRAARIILPKTSETSRAVDGVNNE